MISKMLTFRPPQIPELCQGFRNSPPRARRGERLRVPNSLFQPLINGHLDNAFHPGSPRQLPDRAGVLLNHVRDEGRHRDAKLLQHR